MINNKITIAEIITLSYVGMIFCALINEVSYYEVFCINILEYSNLTDYLLGFIPTANGLTMILTIAFILALLLQLDGKKILKIKGKGRLVLEILSFLLLFLSFFLVVYYHYLDSLMMHHITIQIFVIISSMVSTVAIFGTKKLQRKYKRLLQSLYIFLLYLLFTTAISYESYYRAIGLFKDDIIAEVRFHYKEKTIETDENLIYIGSNQEYIFLFDFYDWTSKIYPKKDIDFLEFNHFDLSE